MVGDGEPIPMRMIGRMNKGMAHMAPEFRSLPDDTMA